MPRRVPSETEVVGYVKSLSNWGRWGVEDELGTINLITPAKRAGRFVRHPCFSLSNGIPSLRGFQVY